MSSKEIAIQVTELSKRYEIYDHPSDRLKQFIFSRLIRLFGKKSINYFRNFWALKDLSFEVYRGETVGIIGKNGAGKSTLLQIITGVLSPTAGQIHINGRVAALLELGAGFNPEFTGRENVYLIAAIYGLSRQQIQEQFPKIIEFAEIGDFIDQPVKSYSSGMFVRLAFAIIANVDADILIVDEALSVGDVFFNQKCMRFLRNFMKKGTLLFVSHDISAVTGLCDRAIWLDSGEIRLIGSVKKVTEAYIEPSISCQNLNFMLEGNQSLNTPDLIDEEIQIKIDLKVTSDISLDKSNSLKCFKFRPGVSAGFGDGLAMITYVKITNECHLELSNFYGGENINLIIEANIYKNIESPIFGFFLKDRLGQVLFGDNTYLAYSSATISARSGSKLCASFSFFMPKLPAGEYSIAAAIASGTQENHTQHHWVHDALIIKSLSSSVCSGLVGIPIDKIKISKLEAY